jgi:hypothetical protein
MDACSYPLGGLPYEPGARRPPPRRYGGRLRGHLVPNLAPSPPAGGMCDDVRVLHVERGSMVRPTCSSRLVLRSRPVSRTVDLRALPRCRHRRDAERACTRHRLADDRGALGDAEDSGGVMCALLSAESVMWRGRHSHHGLPGEQSQTLRPPAQFERPSPSSPKIGRRLVCRAGTTLTSTSRPSGPIVDAGYDEVSREPGGAHFCGVLLLLRRECPSRPAEATMTTASIPARIIGGRGVACMPLRPS